MSSARKDGILVDPVVVVTVRDHGSDLLRFGDGTGPEPREGGLGCQGDGGACRGQPFVGGSRRIALIFVVEVVIAAL